MLTIARIKELAACAARDTMQQQYRIVESWTVETIGYKNNPNLRCKTWLTNFAAAHREAATMISMGWHIAIIYPTSDERMIP